MPGIVGIISKNPNEKNKSDVQGMVKTMLHEQFYVSGTYDDDRLHAHVGWIVHEGSFSDCMPVLNEKKNIALIYQGENFTDKQTFDQLKSKNHKFDNSNASYLIHLYEEYGIDFLKLLNGWFTGVIIDTVASKIILFNDIYGMQKIFYYEGKDAFYFASEAKALLKVCPELREIDMRSLGEFLSCECVLEHRTLFKNVYVLPGSSAWQFNNQSIIEKKTYFNPQVWEDQPWLEKEFFYGKLRETFAQILPRYFRANQPIGISLTGGLDTRIIMANAELAAGKYPCYTFGGMYRDCHDVKVARKVADRCDQPHTTLELDKSFLSDFAKYAEKTVYITDGYLDVSRAPEIYLNRKAREIAPVRITGNYGGEVLRDISGKLKTTPPQPALFDKELQCCFRKAAQTVAQVNNSAKHHLTFNLFTEIPWLRNQGFISEQSQVIPRTPYMDSDLVALIYRAPVDARNSRELSLRLINDANARLGAIPTDRGFGGNRTFILSFLREQFLNFLFKSEYAYNYGMPQWLAKVDGLCKSIHFDRLFLGHHKFAHFRLWYRDELSGYVKDVLFDHRTYARPYINRLAMNKIVLRHTTGFSNYTTEISKLLTIELMHRLLLEI